MWLKHSWPNNVGALLLGSSIRTIQVPAWIVIIVIDWFDFEQVVINYGKRAHSFEDLPTFAATS